MPFCARKCAYCDFTSFTGREHDVKKYLQALESEITQAEREFGPLELNTIFIGGGTPSILPEEAITE
jgi:oxygen-independent coproporphyrinogen-3 oxidase